MKIMPIISSIFLFGSLATASESTQIISLEVPAITNNVATLRIVVRDQNGAEVAVSEPLVVDVQGLEGGQQLATITVQSGESSADVKVKGRLVVDAIESSRILGLVRIGDTGLHAGVVRPIPTATAVAN